MGIHFQTFSVQNSTKLDYYLDVIRGGTSSSHIFSRSDATAVLLKILEKKWDTIQCEHCYTLAWALANNVQAHCSRLIVVEQNAEFQVAEDTARFTKISHIRRLAHRLEARNLRSMIRATYPHADSVIFLSKYDQTVSTSVAHTKNALSLNVTLSRMSTRKLDFDLKDRVVFFSTIGYFPNTEGLGWFTKFVFPILLKKHPSVKLIVIVSSVAEADIVKTICPHPSLLIKHSKNYQEADAEIVSSDVFISPIRLGSGIKMKNIVALGLGMPIVATPESWRGIEGESGREVAVASSPESFCDCISELLDNSSLRKQRSQAALNLFETRYLESASAQHWIRPFHSGKTA